MTQTSVGHDCLDPSYLPTFIKPAPIQKLQLGNKFQFQKWAHLHALQDSFANVQGIGKSKIKAKTQKQTRLVLFPENYVKLNIQVKKVRKWRKVPPSFVYAIPA